jgi:hypothetical protein
MACEVTYRVLFIVSQQKVNKSFIKLNEEIILRKMELKKRGENYMGNELADIQPAAFKANNPIALGSI